MILKIFSAMAFIGISLLSSNMAEAATKKIQKPSSANPADVKNVEIDAVSAPAICYTPNLSTTLAVTVKDVNSSKTAITTYLHRPLKAGKNEILEFATQVDSANVGAKMKVDIILSIPYTKASGGPSVTYRAPQYNQPLGAICASSFPEPEESICKLKDVLIDESIPADQTYSSRTAGSYIFNVKFGRDSARCKERQYRMDVLPVLVSRDNDPGQPPPVKPPEPVDMKP